MADVNATVSKRSSHGFLQSNYHDHGKGKAFKNSTHVTVDTSYRVFQLWEAGSTSLPKDPGQSRKSITIAKGNPSCK